MNFEINKIKACTTFKEIMDSFKEFMYTFEKENIIIFLESFVTPADKFSVFVFSIMFELRDKKYSKQYKLDISFHSTAQLTLCCNFFWLEDIDMFWERLTSTKLYQLITKENLEVLNVELLEFNL